MKPLVARRVQWEVGGRCSDLDGDVERLGVREQTRNKARRDHGGDLVVGHANADLVRVRLGRQETELVVVDGLRSGEGPSAEVAHQLEGQTAHAKVSAMLVRVDEALVGDLRELAGRVAVAHGRVPNEGVCVVDLSGPLRLSGRSADARGVASAIDWSCYANG